jgi:hypothetical protein
MANEKTDIICFWRHSVKTTVYFAALISVLCGNGDGSLLYIHINLGPIPSERLCTHTNTVKSGVNIDNPSLGIEKPIYCIYFLHFISQGSRTCRLFITVKKDVMSCKASSLME